MMKRMTTIDASKEVVVVTDPYSTGCLVVNEMASRGYRVMALWTSGFSEEMKTHTPLAAGIMRYHAEVTERGTLAETVAEVYKAAGKLRVVACIAGGEAGVDCADALSERMGLRTNGTGIANRRDKKVQQELIRDAGMRSVRQAAGKTLEDVEDFLLMESYPVVLKPTDSAGSDGVKLCHNIEEAKEHFHHLFEVEAVNGGFNTEVLCQEFLRGKEYVIDQVSREGVHKTMMVWVYDKRPANNSAFVYFGMVPVDPDSPEARILIPYARGVLDVLGVRNGPSHAEVILTPTGPCLVEMNVRAHGGDGNWRSLARGLTGGYSQVEVTVDSYLDKKQFSLLPDLPPHPFKSSGQEVILVSFSRGKVIATPGYDVIRGLKSFVYMETGIKVGSRVERTVDLLTGIGSVILMHSDATVLGADVAKIREMEKNNELFEYERSGAMFTAVSQRHLSEILVQEGNGY
jgi:biotin carboxylase